MRPLFLTALLAAAACVFACAPARAQHEDRTSEKKQPPLIDCPGGKVALFEDGVSPDGRYGVGWTIFPAAAAKPVDWSRYAKMDAKEFADELLFANDGRDYGIDNCFVDIRSRKLIDLPSERPYWWKENHAFYRAYWSPGTKLPRYCLMQNQKRFATLNLYLIRMDSTGMSQVDLVPHLEKAVRPMLRALRPLYFKNMAISYPNSEWDDVYQEPVFHGATADIDFNADIPKASYDTVAGTVTVSLPEGKVISVACNAKRDDPFRDDAALAKADAELNIAYNILQKRLDPARRAELKNGQLEWLKQRDDTAAKDYLDLGMELDHIQFTRERNKRLVDVTGERTKALKAMLGK